VEDVVGLPESKVPGGLRVGALVAVLKRVPRQRLQRLGDLGLW
jgi:hypothetical protein